MTPAEELTFLRTLQRNIRYFEVMGRAPLGTEWLRLKVVARMAALALVVAAGGAKAQPHHHAQGHDHYLHWHNKNDVNCCNNQDCGKVADSDERMSRGVIEVRVGEQWCPVLPHHYLKRGNTPDWSVSHVCIRKHSIAADQSVCDRLLCYQPRPGI